MEVASRDRRRESDRTRGRGRDTQAAVVCPARAQPTKSGPEKQGGGQLQQLPPHGACGALVWVAPHNNLASWPSFRLGKNLQLNFRVRVWACLLANFVEIFERSRLE